jgi:hypothetical protein
MKELIIVKLGNEDRPASQEDIDAMAKTLRKALRKGKNVVVTHHAVSFEVLPIGNINDVMVVAAGKTVV